MPLATFRRLAELVAAHPRMLTLFSMGANQSVVGTDKGNAIINLHLATGRLAKPGAGPFSVTGQPNAMGGREVGGLANMLACHLGFSEAERADAAEFWRSDRLCAGPGLKAIEMFRAIHQGRIKFLWVMATNPAVSLPDAGFVREALARCPTVVVSDVIAETDTARFAHVRLPALAWGEKDGTVTNSERRISRQRALFAAPGQARADWRIVCDVAARLGWGESFAFPGAASIFREYAAMTALAPRHGKLLDLSDKARLTDPAYDALEPFRWGGERPFARRFSHPDGKARLVAVTPPPPAPATLPLRLNTGRYRDQWHTMTRTGLSATLSQHRREPLLDIHPADARRFGLEEGGLAEVGTARGRAVFRVRVEAGQRRGELFAPMHWTDALAGGGRTNTLSAQRTDPVSGQPGFKDTPAAVRSVRPEWRGFLATTGEPSPDGLLYWAKARVKGGWLYELAGMSEPNIEALLPVGQRIEVNDLGRQMHRIAVLDDAARLTAALYLTRDGGLPPREWIAAQLGQDAASAPELLAARPATPQENDGLLVCLCLGVAERPILAAVRAGAATLAAIGECTAAGTNCGSCRPAIARLLAEAASEREAA